MSMQAVMASSFLLLSVCAPPVLAQTRPSPIDPFQGAAKGTRLLVIAPQRMVAALQPLIAHKNATGMPACLVSLADLTKSFPGVDDAERCKRGIAYAHENLGVRYAMLVGDGSLFPVRYRQVQQVDMTTELDGTYNPSDLYYANLYHDHEPASDPPDPLSIRVNGKFDDWDADGDGIYDEQHWNEDAITYNPDKVDGCPDVAVARLPVQSEDEVKTFIERVIAYETGNHALAWAQHTAFVADHRLDGSTGIADDVAHQCGLLEAPRSVERLLLNIGAKEAIGNPWVRGDFDAIDAAARRSWWLTYVGHACQRFWAVREKGRGYDDTRVSKLATAPSEAPVVYCIGCESGMFANYQPSSAYVDQKGKRHVFHWNGDSKIWIDLVTGDKVKNRLIVPQPCCYEPADESNKTFACSWLLRAGGGGIAYFGQSLVCEADKGQDLLKAMLHRHQHGERVLGDLWLQGGRQYWLDNRGTENVFRNPRIYLGIMTMFGDPSLRLPGWKKS